MTEARPWRLRLMCCGRDEGEQRFATGIEADGYRDGYISGPAVAEHGYSSHAGEPGHRRAAIKEYAPENSPAYAVSEEPGFWEADFYSCDEGDEELTHTDPEDATEQAFDAWLSPKVSPLEHLRTMVGETIKVYAFKRRVLDPLDPNANAIVERIYEDLDDEYGGGDSPSEPTKDVLLAAHRLAMAIRADYQVWQCEKVAEATFNVDAWVKECRPDWLEPA